MIAPMTTEDPALDALIEQVQAARAAGTKLDIRGGGSKAWWGEPVATDTQALDVKPLAGISSYEPSELVVTARAGTPLHELEAVLAAQGQGLAFEPPRFAVNGAHTHGTGGSTDGGTGGGTGGGTVGGMVAAGLAGPARLAAGGLRDHVLGVTLLNGRGELLSFGGQVIKNVAGYDVSRLLAGSQGVLGVICEVSLKVLPLPPATATLRFDLDEATAIRRVNEWGGQPLPLHATAWWEGTLVVRLSGAAAAVQSACTRLGGEAIAPDMAAGFWTGLRDQHDEFFIGAQRAVQLGATLWRLAVPPTTPPLKLSGEQLIEWGGGQRWLCTTAPAAALREAALAAGGHATLWRSKDRRPGVFTPPKPPLDRIHAQIKQAFDPDGLFNPGRLLAGM